MLKNCQPQPWGKANQVSTKLTKENMGFKFKQAAVVKRK